MEKHIYEQVFLSEENYWWYKTYQQLVIHKLSKHITPRSKVLDAGCGTGRMLELLNEKYDAFGIDFSAEAIGFCKKRGLQNVQQANLNNYLFVPETYDAIVCTDVIYHRAINSDHLLIGKFYKALKNNGLLIVTVPAYELLRRQHDTLVHGARRYSRKSLKKILTTHNFKIETLSYRLPWLLLPMWLSKFKPQTDALSDLKKLPDFLNLMLYKVSLIENFFIGHNIPIPFGTSIIAVAQKVKSERSG